MKRWIGLVLSVSLLLSACVIGAAADEPAAHRVVTQVLGEGTVIPDVTTVAHGGDLRLYFYPEDGYEVTAVFLNGVPVTYALTQREHVRTCDGCDTCDWIDWDLLEVLLADDDWSAWKQYVDLGNVCADKLVTVEFSEKKTDAEPVSGSLAQFSDLKSDAWYADAAAYVVENNLMSGNGERFDPNGSMTRAMIVTVLWRMEGCPEVEEAPSFTDVMAADWYGAAVRWAAAEEIVQGHGSRFAPKDPVTREQLASILWRYAKYKNIDVSVGKNTNILSYEDAFDVSGWAYPGLQWACGAGIMEGANGWLMPQGEATRIQTAAMLFRFAAQ